MATHRHRARQRAAPFLALAALSAMAWAPLADYFVDDAFITYRYAARLAEGQGLTYNDGEVGVLGTTTAGYTGLLAAAHLVGLEDLPQVSWGIGWLATAVAAGLGFRLLRRSLDPVAAFAGAATLAVSPIVARSAGMEAPLVLAFGVAYLLAVVKGRPAAAGGLLGAALWLRPDALLLAAATLPFQLGDAERRGRWLVSSTFAAVLYTPWLVGSWVVYGSPWPHGLTAKRAAGEALPEVASYDFFAAGLWRIPRELVAEDPWLLALGVLVVLGLGGVAFGRGRPAVGAWGAILVWAGLHIVAYEVVGLPWRHLWYWVPVQLAVAALAGIAVDPVVRRFRRTDLERTVLVRVGAVLAAVVVVVALVAEVRTSRRSPARALKGSLYAEVGDAVECAPGEWLAAWEIGVLGWTTGCSMLDLFGLVSPTVLRVGPEAAVTGRAPAWTVDYEAEGYEAERTFAASRPGGEGRVAATVYRRE